MTREWWSDTLSNPKYAGHQMPTAYQGYKPGKEAPKRPRRTDDSTLIPCALPPIFTMAEYRQMRMIARSRGKGSPGRPSEEPSILSGSTMRRF